MIGSPCFLSLTDGPRLLSNLRPEHLEDVAALAVIHVTHARDRPRDRHVEPAVADDRLIDMDADDFAKDHDIVCKTARKRLRLDDVGDLAFEHCEGLADI